MRQRGRMWQDPTSTSLRAVEKYASSRGHTRHATSAVPCLPNSCQCLQPRGVRPAVSVGCPALWKNCEVIGKGGGSHEAKEMCVSLLIFSFRHY